VKLFCNALNKKTPVGVGFWWYSFFIFEVVGVAVEDMFRPFLPSWFSFNHVRPNIRRALKT
jgi:hypothetical protein